MSKWLRWLRDAVIIVGISLALLVLLEVGLRLYMGPPGYRFDEDRIATLTSNASKVYVRWIDGGPRLVRWRTNERGFRGPELAADPDLRIIVYGDSNVHARFSRQADSFTGQLEQILQRDRPGRVEVINAGVVGYGPDQSLLRLRSDIEPLHPGAIVFHLFAENDFGDIVRNRLFELDDEGRLVRTPHPVTPDPRMPTSIWAIPNGEVLRSSRLVLFAESFMRGRARSAEPHPPLDHDPDKFRKKTLGQHAREFAVYRAGGPRKYSMFSDHYEGDIAFDPESESARTKRALLAAVLAEVKATADAHSVPLLVVIQPNSRDLTTNLPNHHEALAGTRGYDRRRLDRWMSEVCEAASIEYVNLFDVFEARGDVDELYFPTPDPHWNEKGQQVAAEAVGARLAETLR